MTDHTATPAEHDIDRGPTSADDSDLGTDGRAPSLDRDVRRALMEKRDGPGLARLAVQLPWFFGSLGAGIYLASSDSGLFWLAVVSAGVALATLFPALHEAGHGTAFATDWLNRATVWICAPLMLQAPSFFREFHWQHHRKTQNLEDDPEISGAPELLDPWPTNPITYLLLASGQHLMLGKAALTLGCAIAPRWTFENHFPFIRERYRRRIAWESRGVALGLGVIAAAGIFWVPGAAWALVAWPICHIVLGLYLMPEHTGLPHDGSQLEKTRTVRSNALVRWLMWNMPYHAEHHHLPAVPFHNVPKLHAHIEPGLRHVSRGYLAFHAEALAHAFRLRR